MGSRGPKPKSEQERQAQTELLKVTAESWAIFFYTLRDGSPGVIQSVEWGPWEEWLGIVKLGPGEIFQTQDKDRISQFRKSKRIVGIRFLGLDTSREDEEKIFRELKKRDDLVVCMPVKPSPGLWRRFRDARTATEHASAVSSLEEWWKALYGTGEGSLFPVLSSSTTTSKDEFGLLASRALFNAKKLWLYPRTDRPKSDDKRIEFFAKGAAGLRLGIAPATALRKLARFRFAKNIAGEQQRHEFVERIRTEIRSRRAKP